MRKNILTAALLPLVFAVQTAAASESLWHVSATAARSESTAAAAPGQRLRLDEAALQRFLGGDGARGRALALPRPQGGFDEFVLRDSGTLPPELAAKFPQIRSYIGTAADGREARIDVSPQGLQAMVFDNDGIWLVHKPSAAAGAKHAEAHSDDYLSVARHDLPGPDRSFRCGVHAQPDARQLQFKSTTAAPAPLTVTGTVRRNYRIAVATTYEYTRAVSRNGAANVADGLAAVAAAINRVNQVYERDLGIHLTLVASNDRVIYTTANDPYVNGDDDIDVNTGRLNTVIGSANYDIGHVFTTGSGLAGAGVVCSAQKGEGTTGATDPSGDAFYIDYVAHEIGHQFNAMHTFNGTQGACTSRNRYGPTAYEPGSGTTILSYAGICDGSDLQPHSDPYFHAISLAEIAAFSVGDGARCGSTSNSPGAAPVIDPLSNFIVPARTPFLLTGAARSDSSNTLSYAWEQFDLGNANGNLNADPGAGPIIRSLNPGSSPSRMIPRLSTVLGGVAQTGEILPTTNRTLHFRLTVRDAAAGYGRSNSADMTVQSVNTGSAFAVTAPNTAVNWTAGSSQSVNWNVAGSAATPIACARVGLDLSIDGGQTFAHHLGVFDNNGSARVTVPNLSTAQARIRASCVGNIFFNISAPDFRISAGGSGGTQTYRNDADVQIPDNNTTGASSTITISGRSGNAPNNTSVAVNIVHPYIGDLKLDLIAPDGSVYALRSNSGGGAANIVESYTRDLSSETLNGSWKLRAVDNAGRDVGYINSWSITF